MPENKKHALELTERKNLTVSGIDDVISFDESCIVLSSTDGIISVDGSEMRIVSLDLESGKVDISGSINGIIYPESLKSGGLFKRKR